MIRSHETMRALPSFMHPLSPTRVARMLVFVAWLVPATPVFAQVADAAKPDAGAAAAVPDPFDRETPRGAVTGLLDALGAQDFERASHYFEGGGASVEGVPSSRREREAARAVELARTLKAVLDHGGKLRPYAVLSNERAGKVDDGLAPELEEVGSLPSGDGRTSILLRRTQGADGAPRWLISPATEKAIAASASQYPSPAAANDKSIAIGGAPLFDWLKLLGIALVAFIVLRLLASGVLAVAKRFQRDHEANPLFRFLHAGMPPLALYLSVIAFYLLAGQVQAGIIARQTLLRYAGVVAWVALAWFLLRLVDALAGIATARMRRAERRQAVSIITFVRRGAKFVLLVIATIAVLDTIGVDVTTGIAALGIGGIALALGAQKTIENLVGSVTLIMDKPLQVGDLAQVANVTGTVEDIGMRATRLRTNRRTVVSIPNGQLAGERIENLSKRDRFLFQQTLGVSYDVDASTMEAVLEALRGILRDSPDVIDEDARVRFIGFGDSSLDLEFFAYFRTRAYAQSLEMQERLLLSIMRKLQELDVEIAFPSHTLYVRSDGDPAAVVAGQRPQPATGPAA